MVRTPPSHPSPLPSCRALNTKQADQSPLPPPPPPPSCPSLSRRAALDIAYAFVLPLFLVLLINRLAGASAHKHHVSVLGLAIALALTALLTDLAKNAAGRPRPDLLARCKPAPGTPRPALVTVAACTETRPQLLHDGWRSFPSGHSSFAFAGLGHLALFLAGQLRVFSHGAAAADAADERAEKLVRGDLLRALACLLPLLGAAAVAFSRVEDYRHDVYDVCAGALLGWTVTYWSYRRYWPRLGSARADEPFAGPRAKEARRAGAYGRVRDVEEGANVGIALRDLH